MAEMHGIAAQVLGPTDKKAAVECLMKYMEGKFPESTRSKEITIKEKMKELRAFSEKDIQLVPTAGGFKLKIEEKKKGKKK